MDMMQAETIAHLPTVMGPVVYLARMAERPHSYTFPQPPGVPMSNIETETRTVPIHDMRPMAADLSLDREGFELIACPTAQQNFYDDAELRRVCYPETERAVLAATGGERAVIFDHTVRKRQWDGEDRMPGVPRQPVARVHGDYTEKSGPQRVRDIMGDEADALLKRRFAIVNLWRPITGPLRDAPLALCHAGTVADEDWVTHDLIYRDRVGEIFALTYNPTHQWFYAPEMRTDEALLLKCFDSQRDGRARFMPHTSFEDPNAPADKLPRESIELRVLVFF
jgi:hypothetical protein